jgi:hypothetical protein
MTSDEGELTPAEELAEVLELLVDAFGLDADVSVEAADGVLRADR